MTSIVGILCTDGAVIGADSAITQTIGGNMNFFGQTNFRKIRLIGPSVIAAFSGDGDCHHRCCAALQNWVNGNDVRQLTDVEFGVKLSELFRTALGNTGLAVNQYAYDPVIAFNSKNGPAVVYMSAVQHFQPRFVTREGLWFVSSGTGLLYTNPFLGFLRKIFWQDGPPDLQGGVFSAYWALRHACDVSPGGIAPPLAFAVLQRDASGEYTVSELGKDQVDLHEGNFESVNAHIRSFKDIMLGQVEAQEPPKPPQT